MTVQRKTRSFPIGGGGKTTSKWYRIRKRDGKKFILQNNKVDGPPRYTGNQVTDSENHLWPPSGGHKGDVGGPFYTKKRGGSIPSTVFVTSINRDVTYSGTPYTEYFDAQYTLACPVESYDSETATWPPAQDSTESNLNALGATAISRCSPVSSAVELSTALGETYRDGLPSVVGANTWRDRTLRARNAGDEFLNVEFGWLPLVSDIRALGSTIAKSHQLLEQYDADRGKLIRRQYRFPSERSTTETLLGAEFPTGFNSSVGWGPASQKGVWSKKTTTTKHRWFSGAFRYGVPTSGLTSRTGIADLARKADLLFGLSLTPDTIWNLTPWSWATDWVLNTGDVLSNVSDWATHGLVMQYGYMMEETIVNVTYSLTGCSIYGQPVSVPDAELRVTTKKRVRANPFGFGITWDGLSATQTAIAAALGISRS